MRFSRCATSGIAAKMPSCMSAMARMLGTKYAAAADVLRWIGRGSTPSAGGRPSRLVDATDYLGTTCWTVLLDVWLARVGVDDQIAIGCAGRAPGCSASPRPAGTTTTASRSPSRIFASASSVGLVGQLDDRHLARTPRGAGPKAVPIVVHPAHA